MKTIANCYDLMQAQQIKGVLDAAGIPALIPDESVAGIAPHHFLTDSGVRVQVADEHETEAKEIINTPDQPE